MGDMLQETTLKGRCKSFEAGSHLTQTTMVPSEDLVLGQ